MSPRNALSLLAAFAVLLLAGCGGGGGDETTDTAPVTIEETTAITKDELIAQGDGICAEVNAAVGSAEAGEEEGTATRVADLYSGMIERIKGLGTPDDATGYGEFVEAADALDQAESDLALAVERGEEDLVEAESSAASALAEFQEAASEYGFEDCAEGPSAPAAVPGGASGEEVGEEELEYVPGEEEVEAAPEEAAPEEVAPEEVAPETGGGTGTGGGGETGGGGTGGTGGGIGPG